MVYEGSVMTFLLIYIRHKLLQAHACRMDPFPGIYQNQPKQDEKNNNGIGGINGEDVIRISYNTLLTVSTQ